MNIFETGKGHNAVEVIARSLSEINRTLKGFHRNGLMKVEYICGDSDKVNEFLAQHKGNIIGVEHISCCDDLRTPDIVCAITYWAKEEEK